MFDVSVPFFYSDKQIKRKTARSCNRKILGGCEWMKLVFFRHKGDVGDHEIGTGEGFGSEDELAVVGVFADHGELDPFPLGVWA